MNDKMFGLATTSDSTMKKVFLKLLLEQPSGKVYFGGCSKEDKTGDKGKEKEKEKEKEQSDKDPDIAFSGSTGQGGTDFAVSPDQRRFFITLKDEQQNLSAELLSDHLAHLRTLKARGYLNTCGVFLAGNGFKIITAASREEAEKIAASDPLIMKGHYRSYEIQELQSRHLM